MKFVIRRIAVGLLAIPLIAGAYVFFYLGLLLLGAEPNVSISEAYNNGLLIAITSFVFFIFYPQFSNLLNKLI